MEEKLDTIISYLAVIQFLLTALTIFIIVWGIALMRKNNKKP